MYKKIINVPTTIDSNEKIILSEFKYNNDEDTFIFFNIKIKCKFERYQVFNYELYSFFLSKNNDLTTMVEKSYNFYTS